MAGKTSLTEAKPIRTREKEEEEVRGVGIHYMGKKKFVIFSCFLRLFFKKKKNLTRGVRVEAHLDLLC